MFKTYLRTQQEALENYIMNMKGYWSETYDSTDGKYTYILICSMENYTNEGK